MFDLLCNASQRTSHFQLRAVCVLSTFCLRSVCILHYLANLWHGRRNGNIVFRMHCFMTLSWWSLCACPLFSAHQMVADFMSFFTDEPVVFKKSPFFARLLVLDLEPTTKWRVLDIRIAFFKSWLDSDLRSSTNVVFKALYTT